MPNKMFFCRSWVIISDFPLSSNGDLGTTHSSPSEVRIVQGLIHMGKGFLLMVLECIKTKTQGDSKATALRKKGCPNYEKLRQLFALNTATGSLQISSNTPTPNSDEEHALEEELANEALRAQLVDDDCYNPNMEGITQDDPPVDEQTQRADKRPMEEPTTKGKKIAKKVDRASEMSMALQEYTALARERFSNNKKGKSSGSSNHVAQSASGSDPCSLRKALEYDFDNAYFNSDDDDMDIGGCGDDMDTSFSGDDMDMFSDDD
nr:hypothetical protein CFP56_47956 [Quercus suber]